MRFVFRRSLMLLLLLFPLFSHAAVTPWVSFELHHGHITLPVTIAGIETKVVLDSGAQINGINAAFVKANHLELAKGTPVMVRGVYGTQRQTSYNQVPVSLFGTEWKMDQLVTSHFGGKDVGLLLGASFFDKFIFQIDYPHNRLRLIERDSLDMQKYNNIEMRSDEGGSPVVRVKLNNQKSVWLVVDTGNTGGLVLPRLLAEDQGWLDKYETQDTVGMGVNFTALNDSFRLPVISFGPFEVENVAVTVPKDGSIDIMDDPERRSLFAPVHAVRVRGLLGYDVIKHFLLTIDYKYGRMNVAVPEESQG